MEAKILQGLGVVAGTPDIPLWHDGKAFAMELKTGTSRCTQAQIEMLRRLADAGVQTTVAHGLDRALHALESWGLLQGWVQ